MIFGDGGALGDSWESTCVPRNTSWEPLAYTGDETGSIVPSLSEDY